jgi:hypothetical protein
MLRRITEEGSEHVLISRTDAIGGLKAETRAAFDRIYTLHDMGLEQEEPDPAEEVGQPIPGARPEPLGLHAKLFVVEAGWDTTWLIGSANATDAAFFRHNVEFMVELKGRRSDIGIDEILGQEEENALFSVLRVYTVDDTDDGPDGDEQAERLANAVRDWLIDLEMRLEVEEKGEGAFSLALDHGDTDHEAPSGDFDIACWPISLSSEPKRALMPRASFALGVDPSKRDASLCDSHLLWEVSPVGLTSFIAFEIEARVEDQKQTIRFTLNLPILGLPHDREDHIFCAILSNRDQFIRYLRLVLMDRNDGAAMWAEALTDGSGRGGEGRARPADIPLLRELVRALSRSPDRIDHIARVVDRLQRTPEGRDVLPEDFQLLWDVLKEARSELE